jgi:hypothetical protein
MSVQVKVRAKKAQTTESSEVDPETFLFEDDEEEETELPEETESYSTEDIDDEWD